MAILNDLGRKRWSDRLPANRKGTRWDQILQFLVSYRLIGPGSEWEAQRKRGIEQQYGRARRVCVMDRGVPTEAVLAEMCNSDPLVQYLVGTSEGSPVASGERPACQTLAAGARRCAEPAPAKAGVKLLSEDNELYVFAESVDRISEERAMRKRQMKWLWKRLR
jgi:hypothetical protein